MNKTALKKHEIYNKLVEFTEEDLNKIVKFIDTLIQKKKCEEKKIIKLEGILKGQEIDFNELKELKKKTWQHVDQEFTNE